MAQDVDRCGRGSAPARRCRLLLLTVVVAAVSCSSPGRGGPLAYDTSTTTGYDFAVGDLDGEVAAGLSWLANRTDQPIEVEEVTTVLGEPAAEVRRSACVDGPFGVTGALPRGRVRADLDGPFTLQPGDGCTVAVVVSRPPRGTTTYVTSVEVRYRVGGKRFVDVMRNALEVTG